MTYLAVPISATTATEAAVQIKQAKSAGAEMLELRVDYIDSLTPDALDLLLVETAKTSLPAL